MKPAKSTPTTTPAQPVQKKSNFLWWVLGIGGGLAAWLIFSSFKSVTSIDTTIPTPGSGLPPCKDDYDCLRGYWSWELLNTEAKRKAIAGRAKAAGKTVMAQAFDEAQASMSGTATNLSTWETEVSSLIAQWKANTAQVKYITDKAATNGISAEKQYRADAVWSIIWSLSDKAEKSNAGSTSTNTAVDGFGYRKQVNVL